jgi:hypothetical protein
VAVVSCETGPEFQTAGRAAEWVRAFYPDVTVMLDRMVARLASDERDQEALRLIWQSSLANEALLARGESHRAGVIDALVR